MPEKDVFQSKIESSRMLVIVGVLAGVCSIAQGTVVILTGLVYNWAGLDVYSLFLVPCVMTLLYSISAVIYGFLSGKAIQEEEEKELLRKRKGSAFNVQEDVRFTAGRTFTNYQKYAPYILSVISFITMALALFLYWKQWGGRVEVPQPESALHTAFVAALLMAVSLFGGAFCIGQSRSDDFRWLRPAGAWLVAAFVTGLFSVIAALSFKFGYPSADYYLRNIIFVIFVILNFEFLVNFISEFYRPRTIEQERPVYESRLLALFTEPGGVVRNVADTLDYQFGFKVSKTWIYFILEKSLIPFVLLWLTTLWLFTGISEVGPNELGIRERFGKVYSDIPLDPGIHFKLPWPFGYIARYKVDEVHQIVIGPKMLDKKGKKVTTPVVLWTKSHYGEESRFVVASDSKSDRETPVSFLSASVPVQFRIKKKKIADYAYKNRSPKDILKNIGEMVATKYFASVDILKVMSTERGHTVRELKKLLQKAVDKQKLGIEILYVNLHDAHPPVGEVAEAFQDVIGAREEKQEFILKADSYREKTIPAAEARSVELEYGALAYKDNKVKVSQAESERFNKQLEAYNAMPDMFRLRTYLDFLENDCGSCRKYIMSADFPYEIYEINLEKKTRFDLLDVDLGDISTGK